MSGMLLYVLLVMALDDNRFLVRERAQTALYSAGWEAHAAVSCGATDGSCEVRQRCLRILDRWASEWLPEPLPLPSPSDG